MKNQRGGIILETDPESALNNFIENSSIQYFGEGVNGIILRAELTTHGISPYKQLRSANYGEPVEQILIKLSYVISDEDYKIYDEYENYDKEIKSTTPLVPSSLLTTLDMINENRIEEHNKFKTDLSKIVQENSNFIKEVYIQTDIFLKTITYLEPICPAPVYGDVKDNAQSIELLNKMIIQIGDDTITKKLLEKILANFNSYNHLSLGILGMEVAKNFYTLRVLGNASLQGRLSDPINVISSLEHYHRYENMCRLQLINLAIKTGYAHGDFHQSNMMVDIMYKGEYKGLYGKVLLIDFGYASKIPTDILEEIKEHAKNNEYIQILNILYNLPRSDGVKLSDYPKLFAWIANKYNMVNDIYQYNDKPIPIKLDRVGRPLYISGNLVYDINISARYRPIITDLKLNEELITLNNKQQEAIDIRIELFNEDHPELLLPLSNTTKIKLFMGLIENTPLLGGGRSRQTKKVLSSMRKKSHRSKRAKKRQVSYSTRKLRKSGRQFFKNKL